MKNLKSFERFAKGKSENQQRNNTCVIYTRVSTKEQAETNMSLDTQRKACEVFAKKSAFKIMAYFGGTYESAKTDERIEFINMLSFVEKSREKITNIIVYSIDRFSRSGANAIYITEQLQKQGVNVLSVSQPTDVSTSSGMLQQNIQLIFSEYDNKLRREKCIAGMRDKLLRGEWCMKPPFGYDTIIVNGKRSIVPNKDGEFVRKIFLLKYYEQLSQVEIQFRMTAMGAKIKKSKVSAILKNPFYCGILSNSLLKGKLVQGKHEKLISQELFLVVNEILTLARTHSTYTTDNEATPLRRYLVCNECKTSMSGYEVKKKKLHYYKCHVIGCCCNKSAIKIHFQFSELLRHIKIDEKNYPNLKREFTSNFVIVEKISRRNCSLFKAHLTQLKGKVELIEERFALGEIKEIMFKHQLEKFQIEKEKIEKQIDKVQAGLIAKSELNEEAEKIINNLSEVWLNGDLQTKRLIQSLIFPEGIYYSKPTDRLLIKKLSDGFYVSGSSVNS